MYGAVVVVVSVADVVSAVVVVVNAVVFVVNAVIVKFTVFFYQPSWWEAMICDFRWTTLEFVVHTFTKRRNKQQIGGSN